MQATSDRALGIKPLLDVLIFSALVFGVPRLSAQVWTKTSASNKTWNAVTLSGDGSVLAAAISGSSIYVSTNYGITWGVSGAPNKTWAALAASADGKLLLACASFGGIYTSTNFGTTWLSNSVPGNANWDAAAASADGSVLIVGGQVSGPVYYSTNRGASWRSNGIPAGYWTSVAVSADGTRLAAEWSGVIYTSTNSGLTWTNYTTSFGTTIACSGDGNLLSLASSGQLFLSTNWGATWISKAMPSYTSPYAISADGGKIVVAANGVNYLSTNQATSWEATYAPPRSWKPVGFSADGRRMAAVVSGATDGVYLWAPPSLNVTNSGDNLALSWATNGTAFKLLMNTDLTTSNWATVPDLPAFTNSQDQIILSPTNSAAYFRLQSP